MLTVEIMQDLDLSIYLHPAQVISSKRNYCATCDSGPLCSYSNGIYLNDKNTYLDVFDKNKRMTVAYYLLCENCSSHAREYSKELLASFRLAGKSGVLNFLRQTCAFEP